MIRPVVWFIPLSLAITSIAVRNVTAQTLGSGITYQGEVSQGGVPIDGAADFEFRLFDSQTIGVQLAGMTINGLTVTDGRFTTTLTFGDEFNGDERFLEIAVRHPAGSGIFTTLTPRQRLTAAPYALHALASGKPWGTSSNGLNIIASNPGNVGIGTAAPSAPLHISTNFPDLILQDADGTSGQTGLVRYWDSNGNETGRFGFATSGSPDLSVTNNRAGGDIILSPGSNGGVGVGTSTPAVLLHARGTGPVMVLQDTASVANQAGYVGFWNSAGAETGWMGYGTPGSPDMTILNGRANGSISLFAGSGGNINLNTTFGEYVLIPNSHVGIGTSNPITELHVVSPAQNWPALVGENTSINGTGVQGRALAGSGVYGIAVNTTGAGVGVQGRSDSASGFDFLANGAGTNYGSTSSRRWKQNIEPIADPLHMLAQLRGVYYDWDAEHGGNHDLGMIAEEVGAVLPEIVQYEANGVDAIGMDYSKLTPLLVEAVKALRAEKDNEIQSLRNENLSLRERVEALEKLITSSGLPR